MLFTPVNQQKLVSVHALPHSTQYVKVACWFKGGVAWYYVAQRSGPKSIKMQFPPKKEAITSIKFSSTILLYSLVTCAMIMKIVLF